MTESGVYIVGISDIGEKMCAASGRISTQPGDALEIFEKSGDPEKNSALIEKVTKSGHNSTVEHIMFNLAFNNVSVVVEQFMIEFRLASFTVKSRRYVDFADAGYHIPSIADSEMKDEYIRHMDDMFALYKRLTDSGIPKEDARFVLPYSFHSNFFCSLGGRELLHVLYAMLYGRGKDIPEIYALGKQLYSLTASAAPGLVRGFDERKPASDTYDLSFIEASPTDSEEKVKLSAYTENGAETVARAALVEANRFSSKTIDESVGDPDIRKKIIKAVISSSRPRALESISYTFEINGISLSTLTHFARHRIHSLQVPSLMSVDRSKFIIPSSIESSELLEEYKAAFEKTAALFDKFRTGGETEALPYILLSGNTIGIVSTMNARELFLFMQLRTCTRAQWEIREYAEEMLRILREREPEIFSLYGPGCYSRGRCPEGRLSCGRAEEMRKKFG